MAYLLTVDLGTTFTAAAVASGGEPSMVGLGNRALQIPSVLFLAEDGTFVAGESAERRGSVEPQRVAREFKRRLGDDVPVLVGGSPFSAEALMAELLKAVVAQASERMGEAPEHLVLTHPASWGPFKLNALAQVSTLADVGPTQWCAEPAAAAAQYASRASLQPGDRLAVYDLGGGTFDICLLSKTEDGFVMLGPPEGVEHLGGADFDETLFRLVLEALKEPMAGLDPDDPQVVAGLARLRRDCVEAKEALSSEVEVAVPVSLPGASPSIRVTRAEFETRIRPTLKVTVDAMKRALRTAGVTADQLAGIVLVGGSSRIPLVAEMLQQAFRVTTALDTHPKHDIALGAARLFQEVQRSADGIDDALGSLPRPMPIRRPPAASAAPTAAPVRPATQTPVTPSSSMPATPPRPSSPPPQGAPPPPSPAPARSGRPASSSPARTAPASSGHPKQAPPPEPPAPHPPAPKPVAQQPVTPQPSAPQPPTPRQNPRPAEHTQSAPPPQSTAAPLAAAAQAKPAEKPRAAGQPAPPVQPPPPAPPSGGSTPPPPTPITPAWGPAQPPPPPPRQQTHDHALGSAGPSGAATTRRRSSRSVLTVVAVALAAVLGGTAVGVGISRRDDVSAGSSIDTRTTTVSTPTTEPSESIAPIDIPRSDPISDDQMLIQIHFEDNWDIWLGDLDNDEPQTQLTSGERDDISPVLAPDRASFIYSQSPERGTVRLLRVAAAGDGSGDRPLFATVPQECRNGIHRPAWNPADPNLIASVCVGPDRQVGLYVIRLDGTIIRRIEVDGATQMGDPTFSRDGKQLAFWASDTPELDGGTLMLAPTDGSKPAEEFLPTTLPAQDADPVWSPDGAFMAFRRRGGIEPERRDLNVWIVATGGSDGTPKPEPLTSDGADEQDPSWSPDGSHIAFKSARPDDAYPDNVVSRIRVMNKDGDEELVWPENAAGEQTAPAWTRR